MVQFFRDLCLQCNESQHVQIYEEFCCAKLCDSYLAGKFSYSKFSKNLCYTIIQANEHKSTTLSFIKITAFNHQHLRVEHCQHDDPHAKHKSASQVSQCVSLQLFE